MSAFDEFDVCRNILESPLTGVCVVDMQKKILFWSTGAERITGDGRTVMYEFEVSSAGQPLLRGRASIVFDADFGLPAAGSGTHA